MALTVKHLNTDASFLLTFEPIIPNSSPDLQPRPFRILLDPWITGPSKIFHSKISITTHRQPACVASLRDLPEPDLVVISQHKSDHCNEQTLKQLPPSGTKTVILAEPAAARLIRSWKYFDRDKVQTVHKWEDPRLTGRQTVVRVAIPPLMEGGEPGEVTVAFIPQRRDISGLHTAIGITYRPPPACPAPLSCASRRLHLPCPTSSAGILTPPVTPRSHRSFSHLPAIFTSNPFNSSQTTLSHPSQPNPPLHLSAMPPTPTSPGFSVRSVRSVRSVSSLPFSRQSTLASASTATIVPAGPTHAERPLSVLFSPHGLAFASLAPYVSAHLVAEAALPLTALLHCFDAVSNPWWLGGKVLLGAPGGREIAGRLGARCWVSCHDGDKEVRGLATRLLRTRRFGRGEVWEDEGVRGDGEKGGVEKKGPRTEVVALETGEEVVLTVDGMWNAEVEEGGGGGGGGGGVVLKGSVGMGMGMGMGKGAVGLPLTPMPEVREVEVRGFGSVGEVMAMEVRV